MLHSGTNCISDRRGLNDIVAKDHFDFSCFLKLIESNGIFVNSEASDTDDRNV